jgi:hypothetical protein
MSALSFWKAVVSDQSNFLENVIGLLEEHGIRYCVIGGVAVNAYAEPLVTLALDVVVATDQLPAVRALMEREFRVREFPYSLSVYDPGSKLQVQFQLRPEVADFLDRAAYRDVMGLRLRVAAPRDLLKAKVDAALEPTRRPSKRGKDRLDLARLIQRFPDLRSDLPAELLAQVEEAVDPEGFDLPPDDG